MQCPGGSRGSAGPVRPRPLRAQPGASSRWDGWARLSPPISQHGGLGAVGSRDECPRVLSGSREASYRKPGGPRPPRGQAGHSGQLEFCGRALRPLLSEGRASESVTLNPARVPVRVPVHPGLPARPSCRLAGGPAAAPGRPAPSRSFAGPGGGRVRGLGTRPPCLWPDAPLSSPRFRPGPLRRSVGQAAVVMRHFLVLTLEQAKGNRRTSLSYFS